MDDNSTRSWSRLQAEWANEDKVYLDSLQAVERDDTLKRYISSLDVALRYTDEQSIAAAMGSDDMQTIQFLGARAVNSALSAMSLMMRGYYHQSITSLRDIMEVWFLIDDFRFDQKRISQWRTADDRLLRMEYKPVDIRNRLNRIDGIKPEFSWRDKRYKMLSQHGTHATYRGLKIISRDDTIIQGAFHEPDKLKACLEELIMVFCRFARAYAACIERLDPATVSITPTFEQLCATLDRCNQLPYEWVWYDEDLKDLLRPKQ